MKTSPMKIYFSCMSLCCLLTLEALDGRLDEESCEGQVFTLRVSPVDP